MKINDALIGLVLAVFSILLLSAAQAFPPIPGQNFGASLFPELIAIGMLICSVLLVVQGIKNRATDSPMAVPAWLKNKASVLRFSLIPGSLVFYFATADFLGFLIAASMLLIVLFLAFGVRWPIAVMVAFVGTFVIHFAFYSVLMVPLPWGVLETIAW